MRLSKPPAISLSSKIAELSKLNILSLVLVATFLGFYLGSNGEMEYNKLLITLLGTALTAAGSGSLNHYLERDADKKMDRTRNRPLPSGTLTPLFAVLYGMALVVIGSITLAYFVNLLTGFLSLLTAFLYIVVYTPLKKITWLNTSIGSIPGALPIIGGWTAASDSIGPMALVLFGIMYLWQHPHFYAIAWLCKNDYAKANFKMLPVIEESGSRTMRQIFWHLLLMIPLSFLPFIQGNLGIIYLVGVTIITFIFFLSALPLAKDRSSKSALLLLKASVLYLPVLLFIIIIDKGLGS
ncbi:MAG: protoheme IX farnesyltransferase [bacterium TMED144]|nr:MAG: protoheme IX farnesyltransferase [bacterium TMED144]|tara:strand:- start:147 stop:1034 length:888 start_codon:yes stop_codon:yes gene_type:complete